ncbi:MAG: hypothetical protein ACREDR_11685, partial [Blastocatellia bacterium]
MPLNSVLLNGLSKKAARLGPSAKFLAVVWLVFFLLIAFGVHGAPTPALSKFWSRAPYTGYVFGALDRYAKGKANLNSQSLDELLQTVAQDI